MTLHHTKSEVEASKTNISTYGWTHSIAEDWLTLKAENDRLNALCKNLVGEETLDQDGQYETEMMKLQTKLNKLPTTGDGETIIPPVTYWARHTPVGGGLVWFDRFEVDCIDWFGGQWVARNSRGPGGNCCDCADLFKTHEAAEAARKEGDDGN